MRKSTGTILEVRGIAVLRMFVGLLLLQAPFHDDITNILDIYLYVKTMTDSLRKHTSSLSVHVAKI